MKALATRFTLALVASALFFVGCQDEGFINKTTYQGQKVKNYCQDFEEEVQALVEANQGTAVLRVSQYDNSQFDYFYLEPGQMEQIGDTLYARFINDINYDRYLHKGVAVQVRLSYRPQEHLADLEAEPTGELESPLIVDRAYFDANKEPFFVYKFPVMGKIDGKQISLNYSIVLYKKGELKKVFCNTVEAPLGPMDPSCCADQAWRDANPRSIVQVPELDIKPEDYRYEGFTGTLDLIFPMNSTDFEDEELSNVVVNYMTKYEKEGFKVQTINMSGYASQGGTVQYNQDLSQRRVAAVEEGLKKHFEELNRTDISVSSQGMGEDWERFDLLVKTAVFTDDERSQLLNISNSGMTPDEKEAELRKLKFWEKLVKEVLVYNRHVFINFNFQYQPDKMYVENYPSKMPMISPELYNVATKKMTITKFNKGDDANKGLGILNTLIDVNNNRKPNLFAMRSTYHFGLNNVQNAISDIESAMNMAPDNMEYGLAALSYKTKYASSYSLEQQLAMLDDYNKMTTKFPNNSNLVFNKVVMMEKVGFISGALAEYKGLMDNGTKSAALYNNRGVARMKTNRLVEAQADFNEAISMDPNLAEAYFNLAVLSAYKGLPDKTIDHLKKAIELDPTLKEGIFSNPVFDVVKTNQKFKDSFR